MPSANEQEAMTVIADEGGQCTLGVVSRGVGLSRDYARIILEGLGRAEYLDVTRAGKITLKTKGYKAIRREPNFDQLWKGELQEKLGFTLER